MPGHDQDLCFVIMGFGRKTDYSNKESRTLDLDATYRAIIKPAVEAVGLECRRADEITQSGVIDKVMYEKLLRANLVIADISTANPNALYELGVRHALRPHRTIVIKEIDGAFHFDLNHLATLQYKHLGEDIGFTEAKQKRAELEALIRAILGTNSDDSPVYTFLNGLKEPMLEGTAFGAAVDAAAMSAETLSAEVELARKAAAQNPSDHAAARDHFGRALELQRRPTGEPGRQLDPNPYLVQQLALHTYKAKQPDPKTALHKAWKVLEVLRPETSTDPETLGIGGAICKRLRELEGDRRQLDLAIELYGHGFEVRRDYYNGENYATCLDMRAGVQADPAEADYDHRTAEKVRDRVVRILEPLLADPAVSERPDYVWMLATMANLSFVNGRKDAAEYEARFRALPNPPLQPWMVATYEEGKARALALAKSTPAASGTNRMLVKKATPTKLRGKRPSPQRAR